MAGGINIAETIVIWLQFIIITFSLGLFLKIAVEDFLRTCDPVYACFALLFGALLVVDVWMTVEWI